MIIATTTALSDIIARWLTSNIADAPARRQGRKAREGRERSYSLERWESRDEDWETKTEVSGNEREKTLKEGGRTNGFILNSNRRRGVRLLRAVIGGVPAEEEELELEGELSLTSDGDLDLDSTEELDPLTSATDLDTEDATDVQSSSQDQDSFSNRRNRRIRAKRLLRRRRLEGEVDGRGGRLGTRIRSRRVFHWDVAVRRNVLPICVLGYLTMLVLLLLQ